MKAWDGDEAPVVFARLTGAYWLGVEDSDSRWCRELVECDCVHAEAGSERRSDRRVLWGGSRLVWAERLRAVIVPLAAITVMAALAMTVI
ncbi:hypothetical protein GCM10011579_067230 [Streptomyces albiflavescens]|uniref:Uncharacterized protein n=1 Tax=Streptomyces albiflavescens TaxID=1623582 RepID=A0A917Y9I2_9ACTN|nr:hypothetical protein [Streptomyces albiflavescens]GGN81065.1 hypothetical protein GCM10011579_067230 [Streptomyces albiflavescens]